MDNQHSPEADKYNRDMARFRDRQSVSAPAPSEPAGPSPVVGSGGMVGLRAESAYSKEAQELAASMDKNASIELMLMQIEYHQRQIELSQKWIQGCLCHLNQTVLPRWTESTMKRQPEPNAKVSHE